MRDPTELLRVVEHMYRYLRQTYDDPILMHLTTDTVFELGRAAGALHNLRDAIQKDIERTEEANR